MSDDPAPRPHEHGHRARLRERARAAGLAALAPYELLELALFGTVPRKDTKRIAKDLLARFGTLAGVLTAPLAQLTAVRDVGEATALDLHVMHELAVRLQRDDLGARSVISSWSSLLDYVRTRLRFEGREQVRLLFLDNKNQLIRDEASNYGTINHAPLYPREVVRRALELSAASVILVHNHPSGDPEPSRADIEMTREVVAAAKPMGIAVHDHLIVGHDRVESLKSRGLM